jgi:hypothetical protein
MPTDQTSELHSPTALAYETTEEARILLEEDAELIEATRAAAEAAYHLSDAMQPGEREGLLAVAELRPRPSREDTATEDRAAAALTLLADAADEVESLLRGAHASSELRLALGALRRGVGGLADRLGVESSHVHPRDLQTERIALFRRLHAG